MFSLNKLKKICFVLAISQAVALASAQAATITVNNTGDVDGNDRKCTLREAISSIHALKPISTGCSHTGEYGVEDTIQFDPGLSNQVIQLNQDLPLEITKDLVINGLGADQLTIDGISNRPAGVFLISRPPSGGSKPVVSINKLTISRGGRGSGGGGGVLVANAWLHMTDCTVSGNSAGSGGGIYVLDATLKLTDCTVSGNSAGEGGGILGWEDLGYTDITLTTTAVTGNSADLSGGGILVYGDRTSLVISDNSLISDNSADENGGGIFVQFSVGLHIRSSTVSNNIAGIDGGGIYASDESNVVVGRSTVSSNTAQGLGGGITSLSSNVVISNSTISSNTANKSGGGAFFFSDVPDTFLRLRFSTIANNSANDDGGGIALFGENSVAIFSSSIISGNKATDQGDEFGTFGGTFIANDYNLFGDSSNSTAQAIDSFSPDPTGTDIVATNDGSTPTALTSILNSTLKDNGGAIKTHALVAGSPAIDAGSQDPCILSDQRGVSRNDGKCDIGSYEYSFLIFSDSFE